MRTPRGYLAAQIRPILLPSSRSRISAAGDGEGFLAALRLTFYFCIFLRGFIPRANFLSLRPRELDRVDRDVDLLVLELFFPLVFAFDFAFGFLTDCDLPRLVAADGDRVRVNLGILFAGLSWLLNLLISSSSSSSFFDLHA